MLNSSEMTSFVSNHSKTDGVFQALGQNVRIYFKFECAGTKWGIQLFQINKMIIKWRLVGLIALFRLVGLVDIEGDAEFIFWRKNIRDFFLTKSCHKSCQCTMDQFWTQRCGSSPEFSLCYFIFSLKTFMLLFFSIGGKSMFWKCRRRRFYKQLVARIEKRLSDLFWIDRNSVGLLLFLKLCTISQSKSRDILKFNAIFIDISLIIILSIFVSESLELSKNLALFPPIWFAATSPLSLSRW